MSAARLSRPPGPEPVIIPADDYQHEMTAAKGNGKQRAEPVSPLSPRSEAIMMRRNNTTKRVSPLTSPVRAKTAARGRQEVSRGQQRTQRNVPATPRESYPPAHVRNVPARKPVADYRPLRKGAVEAQKPLVINPPRTRQSVQPEHGYYSRPRSASFEAIQDTYLQDFANHAPAPAPQILPIASHRPRSCSVPAQNFDQAQRDNRRSCAACGKSQKNCRDDFLACNTCRGVYYCSNECWERRVCHRSIKCARCACTQASSSADFTVCGKCKNHGREVWYCSDYCWNRRRCHVRADQPPPAAPPNSYGQNPRQAPQDSRHVQRQRRSQVLRDRDVEALRAKKRKPLSERTGCSATVWAVAITFILLCIFVPIIAVYGSHAH